MCRKFNPTLSVYSDSLFNGQLVSTVSGVQRLTFTKGEMKVSFYFESAKSPLATAETPTQLPCRCPNLGV